MCSQFYVGFSCQGNEFSHYMLLSSFFILNRYNNGRFSPKSLLTFIIRTEEIGQHTIYPYAHSFSNLPNAEAMLRPISIPDVKPSALPPGSNFSLVAGKHPLSVMGPLSISSKYPPRRRLRRNLWHGGRARRRWLSASSGAMGRCYDVLFYWYRKPISTLCRESDLTDTNRPKILSTICA